MLCTAIIGGYGLGDSDSELHSSTHSAYDSPSSFIELATSELLLPTPPISVMDPNDHTWIMEEELTRNQLKTDMIEAALQNILAKLDTPQVNENVMYEEPSSGRAELVEEAENYGGKAESEVLGKLSRVKPATPVDFDGDCEKGHAFLNTCSIYFAICGSLFPNDQARIHWTLSYFKSDHVARFANRVIRSVSKGKGDYFKDWEAFEKTFVDQFCPKNEQLTALTKLEGTGWYQTKDLVDDYIHRFQELIDLAVYDDNKTIVIKFRRGLNPTLQNQVTMLGDGAPDFDDPEGWYESTQKVVMNREANEAFVETSRWTSCNSAHSALPLLRPGVLEPGMIRRSAHRWVS
jgi:Retrotransposon gag protein